MSILTKRIFLCIIGILAGLASWPFAEISLLFQTLFPSYLFFSIFLGIIFGLFMGIFFSTSEGVILMDKSKIISGMITGAIIGLIGGIIGFLIGQGILFIIGENFIQSMKDFKNVGLPISRAIGWAFLGIFIGCIEGIRSRSINKIIVGIIGGLLGGAVGGLFVEYSRFIIHDMMFARLIGLLIFGLFIGFFYGLIEKGLSFGVLRLLNGKFKGKEFLINQRKIKIGSSEKNDIRLIDYENVNENHAQIYIKKNEVFIKSLSNKNPVRVNDDIISERILKLEDVIQIGKAKFFYRYN